MSRDSNERDPVRPRLGNLDPDEAEELEARSRRAIGIDERAPISGRGVDVRQKPVSRHDDDEAAVAPVHELDRHVGHCQSRADDHDPFVLRDSREALAAPRIPYGPWVGRERGADRRGELRREVPKT